jgi:hypothetical protein
MENPVKYGVIYRITSPKMRKYIGQTKHNAAYRYKKHVTCAKADNNSKPQCWALNAAIRKYGESVMRVETVFVCALEDLNFWETFFIECEQTLAPKGYNLTKGGSHRKETVSDNTRDLLSFARRKLVSYDLPTGVVEIHNDDQKAYGFIVIKRDGKRVCFTSINLTMDEKYAMAMDCYNTIKAGNVYIHTNKFKRGTDDFDIPMYVSRYGDRGFAVNKPGYPRKSFNVKVGGRRENFAQAIEYLESLGP